MIDADVFVFDLLNWCSIVNDQKKNLTTKYDIPCGIWMINYDKKLQVTQLYYRVSWKEWCVGLLPIPKQWF